jgi:AcrR family transcriptional regulator
MSDSVKARPYHSPRREAQAAATRRAVLLTAKRLFERDGFTATTMPAVAQQTGVALKTVYTAFPSKAGLLHAVWDFALGGDDSGMPVDSRKWYLEAVNEPDPARQLMLNARNSRRGKERISAVLDVVRGGAAVDPDIAALWQTIQVEYHANQRTIVESVRDKKALKRGLDVARATDILWTLNHPDTWQLLVEERRWPPARYERYVGESACVQLLD